MTTGKAFLGKVLLAIAGLLALPAMAQPTTFDPVYFGVHIGRIVPNNLWVEAKLAALRLHDDNVSWAELEPAEGQWQFNRLDAIVAKAGAANAKMLLTLEGTPTWASSNPEKKGAYGQGAAALPTDLGTWDAYVKKVVDRYKGKIEAYEVWNEPNLGQFYSGTPEALSALTVRTAAIIHRVDPDAKVVCAGVTSGYGVPWLREYLAAGAGKSCDIIGYHFYTGHQPPEAMLPTIKAVKGVMAEVGVQDKPLWNTETGWLIDVPGGVNKAVAGFAKDAPVISRNIGVAYVVRALLLARSGGVSRFYWYEWDHPSMGLTAAQGTAWSPPARAFVDLRDFVAGAKVDGCQWDGHVGQCTLILASGEGAQAVWSDNPHAVQLAPGQQLAVFGEDGHLSRQAASSRTLTVGAIPQFVLTKPGR